VVVRVKDTVQHHQEVENEEEDKKEVEDEEEDKEEDMEPLILVKPA